MTRVDDASLKSWRAPMSERIPLGSGANSNRVFIDLTGSDKEAQVSLCVLSSSYPVFCPHCFPYFLYRCQEISFIPLSRLAFFLYHSHLHLSTSCIVYCVIKHLLTYPAIVSRCLCHYISTPITGEASANSPLKKKEFGSV